MKIKLDETLQKYMKEKGYTDLVMYTKAAKGGCCGGSFLDVKVRFAKEEDKELLNTGYVTTETDLGLIYYQPEKLNIGRSPKLILNQFMNIVVIQAMDIGAVDQNHLRGIPV